MKVKEKPKSGSVKIDSDVYREVWDHCQKTGLRIMFFATEAMKEKLEKVRKDKK